jgi:hypothetical protein
LADGPEIDRQSDAFFETTISVSRHRDAIRGRRAQMMDILERQVVAYAMGARARRAALGLIVFGLGCGVPRAPDAGSECAGRIEPREGLKEVEDQERLKSARGLPGQGKLCEAKVFEVVKPLTVYRAWDGSRKDTEFGPWWAADAPAASRREYRSAYVVCPSWSPLTMVSKCRLKVGSRVIVGTGQSAFCKKEGFEMPASGVNQILARDEQWRSEDFVEGCSSEPAWPGKD